MPALAALAAAPTILPLRARCTARRNWAVPIGRAVAEIEVYPASVKVASKSQCWPRPSECPQVRTG